MRPSTSTGHLAHKDDVLTKPDAGVDLASSHYSSRTGKPNHSTQAFDTKECVTPESYNTHQEVPTIMQLPITKLPEPDASAPDIAYTLPVA